MVGEVWFWESALNASRTRTSNEDLQQVLQTIFQYMKVFSGQPQLPARQYSFSVTHKTC